LCSPCVNGIIADIGAQRAAARKSAPRCEGCGTRRGTRHLLCTDRRVLVCGTCNTKVNRQIRRPALFGAPQVTACRNPDRPPAQRLTRPGKGTPKMTHETEWQAEMERRATIDHTAAITDRVDAENYMADVLARAASETPGGRSALADEHICGYCGEHVQPRSDNSCPGCAKYTVFHFARGSRQPELLLRK
jgi:hypothetical protein